MSDMIWGTGKKILSQPAATKDIPPVSGGSGEGAKVETVGNHIYFYNDIDDSSALLLNKELQDSTIKITNGAKSFGIEKPILHLHINSFGGGMFAGVAILDTIKKLRKEIDIYTYVEGIAASAATFVSCAGTKRFITENSVMLIHQVSAGVWGKYREINDTMNNVNLLMKIIKKIYSENTKVPEDQIDHILDRDLYWDSKKCLKFGLVDEII